MKSRIANGAGLLVLAGLLSGGSAGLWAADKPAAKELPMVEVGSIIGDFARSYSNACDKYEGKDFIFEGRVDKITTVHGKDGHTRYTVHLAPRELASSSMVPLFVDFNEKKADEVGKLKVGDLAQITGGFAGQAPGPLSHEIAGFYGISVKSLGPDDKLPKLQEELIDWVRKNNCLETDKTGSNQLVRDMTKKIEASMLQGDDFSITFTGDLLRSGKTTILCVQDGKMLTLEYTADQSKDLKLPEMSAIYASVIADDFRMPAEDSLELPKLLDDAKSWNLPAHLKGNAKIKEFFSHRDLPGDYGLRLVTFVGKKRMTFFSSFKSMQPNIGYNFEFIPLKWEIEQMNLPKDLTPRVVFFEVARRIGPDRVESDKREPKYEIISDPVAMILPMSAK